MGGKEAQEIEQIWPGLTPPYDDLFAWLEGRADQPASGDPAPFRPLMLAHAIEDSDFARLDPADFMAEWKWDGIRVQAVAARRDGNMVARLYSRTGEDISRSFPDLLDALRLPGAIDGELLIMRELACNLQRAAAAAQPQNRHGKAHGRISRASARL